MANWSVNASWEVPHHRLEYLSTVENLDAIDSSTGSELSQTAWFSNCQSESLRQSLQTMLSVGHGIMLANCAWWLYSLADIYLGRWWKPALQQRSRLWDTWTTCRLWLRISNGLICLVVMWALLDLFTAYRHDVLTKAGSANEDNEWTFGQVLSLATWIPIGIELLAVYIYDSNRIFHVMISSQYQEMERAETEGTKNRTTYNNISREETIPLKSEIRPNAEK